MANKFLDNDGVEYLWSKIKEYVTAHGGSTGEVSWEDILNKPDFSNIYRFKGSVNNFSALPTVDNEIGDVWNVIATDMNYGWTGEKWDPLGQVFEIQAITNEEIDAIIGE